MCYLCGRNFLSFEAIPPCSPCNFLPKFELPFTTVRVKIHVAKGWVITRVVFLVPKSVIVIDTLGRNPYIGFLFCTMRTIVKQAKLKLPKLPLK